MILLIDNYDSFSYNLVQLVGELTSGDVCVKRNDEIGIEEIKTMNPSGIILSPGPGRPENAGICEDVVKDLIGEYPILGVCLGHQAICHALGAKIVHAKKLMHGKQGDILQNGSARIFLGIDGEFKGARYHSLSVDKNTLPNELEVIATDKNDGEVMAVKHKDYNVYGLQFHPESVLTLDGRVIVQNFIEMGE